MRRDIEYTALARNGYIGSDVWTYRETHSIIGTKPRSGDNTSTSVLRFNDSYSLFGVKKISHDSYVVFDCHKEDGGLDNVDELIIDVKQTAEEADKLAHYLSRSRLIEHVMPSFQETGNVLVDFSGNERRITRLDSKGAEIEGDFRINRETGEYEAAA